MNIFTIDRNIALIIISTIADSAEGELLLTLEDRNGNELQLRIEENSNAHILSVVNQGSIQVQEY